MSQNVPIKEIDENQPKKDITQNVYYQKIQKSLSIKNNVRQEQQVRQQVPKVEMPDTQDKVHLSAQPKSIFSWKTVNDKGKVNYEINLGDNESFSTSILTSENSLGIIKVLGLKIDLREKMQTYIDSYVKHYVQARSHNLMVAKFAQFNVAIAGQLLSILGMTAEEIKKLQKQAILSAVEENKLLFDENEYNSEMIAIVGGGTKNEIKAQQKVILELRTQFMTQMDRLGYPGHYSERRIKEVQIEQLKKILTAFHEEKNNLDFQLHYVS
ncbi:MAG: hypothetical protein DKM50_11020 [Candidatus Margulisiibacteriota bacterium]|nr:MAG: hypothetical protein DKM50_11020 [Candidatus Margulisiibacteriota bacterium]